MLNRVSFNRDLLSINETDFACIYVDVNELHWRNNKFGHSAGDEMLQFIAHTLKDIFFEQRVYRMGGDEFLVFTHGISEQELTKDIDVFLCQLATRGYDVALGISFGAQGDDVELLVKDAETKMYENKAKYYQNKEQQTKAVSDGEYVHLTTGIPEIDAVLSVLKESYYGIYRVSLDTDRAQHVLKPAYFVKDENEECFSELFANYVSESAGSEYNRALLAFNNYDALKQQLIEGKTPTITYKKLNGDSVKLSVYCLSSTDGSVSETLWIFAKSQNN